MLPPVRHHAPHRLGDGLLVVSVQACAALELPLQPLELMQGWEAVCIRRHAISGGRRWQFGACGGHSTWGREQRLNGAATKRNPPAGSAAVLPSGRQLDPHQHAAWPHLHICATASQLRVFCRTARTRLWQRRAESRAGMSSRGSGGPGAANLAPC